MAFLMMSIQVMWTHKFNQRKIYSQTSMQFRQLKTNF